MKVTFTINYHTRWGQSLWIDCPGDESKQMVPMNYVSDGNWIAQVEMERENLKHFLYKYFLKEEGAATVGEWGAYRALDVKKRGVRRLHVRDSWRPAGDPENVFFSSAFTGNLLARDSGEKKRESPKTDKRANYFFTLSASMISPEHRVCITGSHKALGKWDAGRAVLMDEKNFPEWQAELYFGKGPGIVEYKYGIYSVKEKKLIAWETGENRRLYIEAEQKKSYHLVSDVKFRSGKNLWRGSGVAIPVFSLRTDKSGGVGEFLDLKSLISWAAKSHMRLLQILPVNDTVANHTWKDSYPYSAISIFAMHPIYLNMRAMGTLKDRKEMRKFLSAGKRLNALDKLDYEAVMELKSGFYKRLYDEQKKKVLKSPGFKKFFKENKSWLVPYAVFSCLRDRYRTVDYGRWKELSVYDRKKVRAFADPSADHYDDVAVHYFIQFHLHLQLKDVAGYARKKGVILKGDLPIGIYRYSVEAWKNPELFNMDKQAGAPPDAFSESGQNWGFPTYNWEAMSRDGYRWWRKRLAKMAEYFDAYRMDHILGFFRIWEMPYEQIDGLLGRFNPAIPLYKKDLEQFGFYLDPDKYCKPVIGEDMLDELFGVYKEEVVKKCLISSKPGTYRLRAAFNTQRKAGAHFAVKESDKAAEREKKQTILKGLFKLISDVLFIPDESGDEKGYHPRISLQFTFAFKALDEGEQAALNQLYNHYFYGMQEQFWEREAMKKLPALTGATNMMVCGEDLGMVPQCVPDVMERLGILGLEIQRMPKDHSMEFSNPKAAKYLTVLSTSTHDMSTIRGWWEEDPEVTRHFYHSQLGMEREAPGTCTAEIARKMIELLLNTPAMWAIYPIQDLFAMSDQLKNPDIHAERINIPGISNHYWRYRMHLSLDDLENRDEFRDLIRNMLYSSGRGVLPGW